LPKFEQLSIAHPKHHYIQISNDRNCGNSGNILQHLLELAGFFAQAALTEIELDQFSNNGKRLELVYQNRMCALYPQEGRPDEGGPAEGGSNEGIYYH